MIDLTDFYSKANILGGILLIILLVFFNFFVKFPEKSPQKNLKEIVISGVAQKNKLEVQYP